MGAGACGTYLHLVGQTGHSIGQWRQLELNTNDGDGATDPHSIAWTGASSVMSSTDACGDLDDWWQKVPLVASPSGGATRTPGPFTHERIYTNTAWPSGTW